MRWLIPFFCFAFFEASALELSIKVDTFGVVNSTIKGTCFGQLIVQQFKWNEWCNVDTLGPNRFWSDTTITSSVHLHSGENQFRLMEVPVNPYMQVVYSSVTKIATSFDCYMLGKCNSITFDRETDWEIRDTNNVVLRRGFSFTVNSVGLAKGGYYLYYDNRRSEFFEN